MLDFVTPINQYGALVYTPDLPHLHGKYNQLNPQHEQKSSEEEDLRTIGVIRQTAQEFVLNRVSDAFVFSSPFNFPLDHMKDGIFYIKFSLMLHIISQLPYVIHNTPYKSNMNTLDLKTLVFGMSFTPKPGSHPNKGGKIPHLLLHN